MKEKEIIAVRPELIPAPLPSTIHLHAYFFAERPRDGYEFLLDPGLGAASLHPARVVKAKAPGAHSLCVLVDVEAPAPQQQLSLPPAVKQAELLRLKPGDILALKVAIHGGAGPSALLFLLHRVAAYVAELEERVAELEARLGAGACAQLEGLQDALHRRGAADRLSPQQEALDRAHNPQPESKEKA